MPLFSATSVVLSVLLGTAVPGAGLSARTALGAALATSALVTLSLG